MLLNPVYLQECMRAGGQLGIKETLTEENVKQLLTERIKEISLDAAKEDVLPFLREPTQLDLWSVDFFGHWISLLKFAK